MALYTRLAARVSIIFGFFVKVDTMTTKMQCGKKGCACTNCGCGNACTCASNEDKAAQKAMHERAAAQHRLMVAYYTSYSSVHGSL